MVIITLGKFIKEVSMRNVKRINNDILDFSRKSSFENMPEYQLHCHSFYEIYYFVGGQVEYMVEGTRYIPAPQSVMLFKPGVVHGVQVKEDVLYTRYAFHFVADCIPLEHREALLAPFYDDKIYYECESKELENLFDFVLASEELPKKIREIGVLSRFEALLTQLYTINSHSLEDTISSDSAADIVAYINQHITEEISLDELAKHFFISKSKLNRVFKKSMDTTVGNYISLKRANIARQFMHRGESAENAAVLSGFRDYSTFYRTYKKVLGHSPAETYLHTLFRED